MVNYNRRQDAKALHQQWSALPRWAGVRRWHTAEDVIRQRTISHQSTPATAKHCQRLWQLLNQGPGNGLLRAAEISGCDREAVSTTHRSDLISLASGELAAVESLRPSVLEPAAATRGLRRLLAAPGKPASKPTIESGSLADFPQPVIVAADNSCGTSLNAYAETRRLLQAGASGISFADRYPGRSDGNKAVPTMLIPIATLLHQLAAARLAADIAASTALIIASIGTDPSAPPGLAENHSGADSSDIASSDIASSDTDGSDTDNLEKQRNCWDSRQTSSTPESSIARALACAPYVDAICFDAPASGVGTAVRFAEELRRQHPETALICKIMETDAPGDGAGRLATIRQLRSAGYVCQLTRQATSAIADSHAAPSPVPPEARIAGFFHTSSRYRPAPQAALQGDAHPN